MKISKYFTLEEFVTSETAMKNGFKEQYNPSTEVIKELTYLAVNAADPIREYWGSYSPTVAYRCERTNKAVGGAKNSDHLRGQAFDETFLRDGLNISREVFDWILAGGLKSWSKIILEYPDSKGIPRWLHIGSSENDQSKTVLVAYKKINITTGKEETVYENYYTSKYYKK
jgi:hypothetical protein